MDYDKAIPPVRRSSIALAVLTERALTGVHTHYYPQQEFFILAHLPDGTVNPAPASFHSPEEAGAFLVLLGPYLEEMMPANTKYSIALKVHPTVQ